MRRFVRAAIVGSVCLLLPAGGCASLGGKKFPDPDAAFMKKVAKDPFPKATTAGAAKK